MLYMGMVVKTMWDKGKSTTPYLPDTHFAKIFDCAGRIKEDFTMHRLGDAHPAAKEFFEDGSLFLLQDQRTNMFDVNFLRKYPECVGAFLESQMNDPDHYVVILYDRANKRVVYRIDRINRAAEK